MTPSPARRWLRRTAALLVGAPLFAGLLSATATPAAHAATDAVSGQSVQVSLDSVAPQAPVKSDTLTISGTVTNTGNQAVTSAHVGLRVGQKLSGRSAIDEAARHSATSSATDGAELSDGPTVKFAKLNAGTSQDFTLSVPVAKLGLGDDGVYQLGVSLSGQTANQHYDQMLGIQHTLLPWQPDAVDGKKSQLTFLWPLISSSHLTAQTGSDAQQTPVFADDSLARDIGPGGRLEQMVSLGKQLPVTWVIDPDLLATVDAMTRNYKIKVGDSLVNGTGQDVAKAWLSQLEASVQGEKVVALPFADPDLASLAHHGRDVPGSLGHLQSATEVAQKTVDTILHVTPSVDYAWPVDGAVDPSIVDVATSAGAHNVIARSDSLRDGALAYTPTAARPIGGGANAIVADARLSTAFQGDMSLANTSTLAVQEFLAQTLATTLQDTDKQRSIVVAPQRMPTVSQAQTMATALHALDPQRWTQPLVDLGAAAATKPDPLATTRVPGAGAYPDALRQQELPLDAFQDMKDTQGTLERFKVILTAPDRVVTPFGNAINREMSTSWRGDSGGAQNYRSGVQLYLDGLADQVHLIQKSTATMSGRSATIAVTVQNKLVQGVDHLVLKIQPKSPTRLQLGADGDAVGEQPVKVDGDRSQSVKFTAIANANGPVPVTARLYTQDGTPYGEPMEFTVQVSEITPTVMLVIAGGVLLLVLAGIRMYTHRKRSMAREESEGDDDPGQSNGSADADPGQPSDPTPDTGPESGATPGPGEKVDH